MGLAERLREAGDRCQDGEDAIQDFKRILEPGVSGNVNGSIVEQECLLLDLKAMLDPSTTKGQMLIEAVGWDLPGVIVSYSRVSEKCREVCAELIVILATNCHPREVLATLMEALHSHTKPESLDLCVVLLEGIYSVLPRIQRRRAEFAKQTVHGLLSVAAISRHLEDDEMLHSQILDKLVQMCQALQEMYATEKANSEKETLRVVLSYYALVLLTSVVAAEESDTSDSVPQLLRTLKLLGISIRKLIDRGIVSSFASMLRDEDAASFSYDAEADCGAALAASLLSADTSKDSATDADADADADIDTDAHLSLMEALDLSSNIFRFVLEGKSSWGLAEKGLGFIQSVRASNGDACVIDDEDQIRVRSHLQMLQDVVIRSPFRSLRVSAYDVIVSVLRRTSADARLLCLVSLVGDGCHPSVVSLLLTFAKDEVHSAWQGEGREHNPFVSCRVLELVEIVLRPRGGGPPNLPQNLDAVVGALNLYRFLLLREKSGGTNYTGILSRPELVKAKSQWLEPLRAAICAMPPPDPEFALHVDALQMIRARCLELVEAELDRREG